MTQAVLEAPAPADTAADQRPPCENTSEAAPRPALYQKPAGITQRTWDSLQPKTKVFVAEYVKDADALRAYTVAGYITKRDQRDSLQHSRNAYNVTKGKRVRQALLEHADQRARLAQEKDDIALAWIVSEHQRLMQDAHEKGDLAVETRNLELIGRTRGVYSDTVNIDVVAQRAYSEAEQIEAARLSRLLLTEGDQDEGGSRTPGVTGQEDGDDDGAGDRLGGVGDGGCGGADAAGSGSPAGGVAPEAVNL